MAYNKQEWVKKQKETRKEIKKILDNFIPTLVVSPEEIEKYLGGIRGFYNYSLLNQVCATYEFTAKNGEMPEGIWATYKQFQTKHGRQVRKGQKGVHMIRPQKFKYKVENKEGEEEEKVGTTFKPFVVFDLSQTDGEPIEENNLITGEASITEEQMDRIIQKHWELIITNYELTHGSTNGEWIKVSTHKNTTTNGRISTRIHEIAHIKLEHIKKQTKREIAELEAESVAFMVTTLLGLKNEKSRLYICNWNGYDAREAVKERSQLLLKTAEEIVKMLGIDN